MESTATEFPQEKAEQKPVSKWRSRLILTLKLLCTAIAFLLNYYLSLTKMFTIVGTIYIYIRLAKQMKSEDKKQFIEK